MYQDQAGAVSWLRHHIWIFLCSFRKCLHAARKRRVSVTVLGMCSRRHSNYQQNIGGYYTEKFVISQQDMFWVISSPVQFGALITVTCDRSSERAFMIVRLGWNSNIGISGMTLGHAKIAYNNTHNGNDTTKTCLVNAIVIRDRKSGTIVWVPFWKIRYINLCVLWKYDM